MAAVLPPNRNFTATSSFPEQKAEACKRKETSVIEKLETSRYISRQMLIIQNGSCAAVNYIKIPNMLNLVQPGSEFNSRQTCSTSPFRIEPSPTCVRRTATPCSAVPLETLIVVTYTRDPTLI
jgi:hypothetical protein